MSSPSVRVCVAWVSAFVKLTEAIVLKGSRIVTASLPGLAP